MENVSEGVLEVVRDIEEIYEKRKPHLTEKNCGYKSHIFRAVLQELKQICL